MARRDDLGADGPRGPAAPCVDTGPTTLRSSSLSRWLSLALPGTRWIPLAFAVPRWIPLLNWEVVATALHGGCRWNHKTERWSKRCGVIRAVTSSTTSWSRVTAVADAVIRFACGASPAPRLTVGAPSSSPAPLSQTVSFSRRAVRAANFNAPPVPPSIGETPATSSEPASREARASTRRSPRTPPSSLP